MVTPKQLRLGSNIKKKGNKLATRARFKDSVDFGYTNKSEKILRFLKKMLLSNILLTMRDGEILRIIKNKKVIKLAKKVEKQSNIYKKQLSNCSGSLNKNKFIIFLDNSFNSKSTISILCIFC